MSITRLVATYRLTTPMFCAGANQDAAAELRPASFKGVLRFWYRALALGQCGGDWKEVREAESRLFGSTSAGQAQVLLSLREGKNAHEPMKKGTLLGAGRGYLAGMGLSEPSGKAAQTTRAAISAGAQFAVHLLIKENIEQRELGLLIDALVCIGLFGGLGSRSRRGFGSLTLETLVQNGKEIWSAPRDVEALREAIKTILAGRKCDLSTPPYTAFSTETKVVLLPATHSNPERLHESLGRAFLHYRSYGQNVGGERVVAGRKSLEIFEDDHHDMYDVAIGEVEEWVEPPLRAAFGLPHNYYFKEDKLSVKVNAEEAKRRASPLLLHIHQCAEALPIAIVCFLPAKFLPSRGLRISSKKSKVKAELPNHNELWQPIRDFLDKLCQGDSSDLMETFPNAVEVKP